MTREEALEIIRKNMPSDKSLPVYEAIQTLIPELAESEDERIRKAIIKSIEEDSSVYEQEVSKEQMLAWLEKLNLADLNLLKEFNKGMQEAIMWGREGYEVSPDGKVKCLTQDEIDSVLEKQKECLDDNSKTPVSEDERIRKELIKYLKLVDKGEGDYAHPIVSGWIAYLEKQKDLDKMIVVSPEVWDNAISDAYENGKKEGEKQKEQKSVDYEAELKKCKDNPLYLYDKYMSIKQKPAEWSEEDKKQIAQIERIVKYAGCTKILQGKIHNWLKSLRPSWKPTEEQLEAAQYVSQFDYGGHKAALVSLYEQLKKL